MYLRDDVTLLCRLQSQGSGRLYYSTCGSLLSDVCCHPTANTTEVYLALAVIATSRLPLAVRDYMKPKMCDCDIYMYTVHVHVRTLHELKDVI